MVGVSLVYGGLVALAAGGVALLSRRWRRPGLVTVAGGLVALLTGFALPARERRAGIPRSRLDEFVPAYQFHESHAARVNTDCSVAYDAIKRVTAPEIAFFRTLTAIRRLGRPGPESILSAPDQVPLIDVATRTGFVALANDPGVEIVIGTLVIAPPESIARQPTTPAEFAALRRPGMAKAVMNFRLAADAGGACLVTTETRVFATDPRTTGRFARYWRVIYPGSALIRRMWLRAVKRRAERSAG
jgi:hypothetical protein